MWLIVLSMVPCFGEEPFPSQSDTRRLVRDLGNRRFFVREAATRKLLKIGPPALPALHAAIASGDLEVRCRAQRILEKLRGSMDFLLAELTDPEVSPTNRRLAVEALARQGAKAKVAVPALLEAWKQGDAKLKDAIVSAVLAIDPENKALEKIFHSKATVNGKYRRLLRRVHVPMDRQNYTDFKDYGHYQATDYGGEKAIPAGYWVYVYPYWYIWAEVAPGR